MPQVRENPQKWARNSAAAGQDYAQGVQNPRRSWQQAASDAEDLYEAGVQLAIAENRYGEGVNRAGDAKYRQGVQEKGISRFTQGVTTPSAQSRYQQGFAPFAAAIESVTLPPKQPKGQNLERVRIIQDALIAAKANR